MTLCYTSHLFRPICLYDFIFGHCVVERLLLVNLVANSMAFCHILLHVDRLLARRQCLVDCSALLLPCNVWNGDVPEGEVRVESISIILLLASRREPCEAPGGKLAEELVSNTAGRNRSSKAGSGERWSFLKNL